MVLPDDEEGWRALSRPFAGRLRLLPPAGISRRFKDARKRIFGRGEEDFAEVDVWLQSGLHYSIVTRGQRAAAAPIPGQPLPSRADDHLEGFRFVPLRRDGADGAPHFDVLVHPLQKPRRAAVGDDQWVVEVYCPPSEIAVTFVARNEKEAREWERQLAMRATPLTVVWSALFGIGGTSGHGSGGPSTHPSGGRISALMAKLEDLLSKDVITGAAEVVTAVAHEAAYDLAVAAGPLAAFAVSMLCSAARVCAATCRAGHVAAKLQEEAGALSEVVRNFLLPAVVNLKDARQHCAPGLVGQVREVAADLDALTGRLLHVALSRLAGAKEALAARGGVDDGSLGRELSACKEAVDGLMNTATLAQVTAQLSTANKDTAQLLQDKAAEVAVPPVPDRIVARWDDNSADQPWCKLLAVVLRPPPASGGGTRACIASTHGMGGVGKTVVCQLVAERAALSDRYEHGVFWVKLGQAAGDVEAMYGMLAVATVVAQEKVTAPDVDVAAKKLREKLLSKACLVVVDDCWDQRLVRLFVNAVNDAACSRCTMLFSTRDARIADIVEDRSCRVQVRLMDDELGRAVLRSHAMRDGQLFREPATEADKAGLALMLTVAAGLPLALGVLGAIVRKTENWAATAADLQGALDDQPDSMDKKHKSLSACFTVGYDQLAAGDPRPDLRKDRFRALCVLSKQEFVPPSTLSALWDLDPASAEAEAREMGHMAMATVREEAGRLHLGLHDLLIDWIKDKLVTGSEREIYHKKLVDGYERRLGLCRSDFGASSTVQCRPWWNLEAAGDRYIKNTLCRHLHAGGPASQRELEALLWDWRWIEWRLRDGGSPGFAYRTDCHIAGGASIQRLRKIVVGAVAVSFSMGVSAVRQVAFELSERLRVAAGTAEDCASRQLRLAAKRSLCYPSIELLRAGSLDEPREVSILAGHEMAVNCTCTLRDTRGRTILVSGSSDNTLRVWDVTRDEELAVLEGHTDYVMCVCVVDVPGAAGGGGTVQRVVSGSGDNTLRVWEISAAGGASLSSSMNLSGQPVMICRARCVTRSAVLVTTVLGALYLADCVEGLFFSLACPAPVAVAHPLGMGRLVLGAKTGAMHWARGAFEF